MRLAAECEPLRALAVDRFVYQEIHPKLPEESEIGACTNAIIQVNTTVHRGNTIPRLSDSPRETSLCAINRAQRIARLINQQQWLRGACKLNIIFLVLFAVVRC